MTPQIITETLYVLTQIRGERIDEIRVITTGEGRNRIQETLLDKSSGKFFEFCSDYSIDPGSIKFDVNAIALLRTPDGLTLSDIREPNDNELAGNQICEIVRALTEDPNTCIHASAAGGRKTMSIYLTAAMQLFGRRDDTLSHVLVSGDFESPMLEPEFYYPPPKSRTLTNKRTGAKLSTADAKIYLVDINFIRLRAILGGWRQAAGSSYVDYVSHAQQELTLLESAHELVYKCSKRVVVVAGQQITLSKRLFFFYALFARLRSIGAGSVGDGFVSIDEINLDHVIETFSLVSGIPDTESPEDFSSVPGYDFMDRVIAGVRSQGVDPDFQDDFLQIKSKIKGRLRKHIASELITERFSIAANGVKPDTRYGLNIDRDKIVFEK
jgi:CRISPR-associated protein (TIGR02584 family)